MDYIDRIWQDLVSLIKISFKYLFFLEKQRTFTLPGHPVFSGVWVAHSLCFFVALFQFLHVLCCVCVFSMSGLCPWITLFWLPLEPWFHWLLFKCMFFKEHFCIYLLLRLIIRRFYLFIIIIYHLIFYIVLFNHLKTPVYFLCLKRVEINGWPGRRVKVSAKLTPHKWLIHLSQLIY